MSNFLYDEFGDLIISNNNDKESSSSSSSSSKTSIKIESNQIKIKTETEINNFSGVEKIFAYEDNQNITDPIIQPNYENDPSKTQDEIKITSRFDINYLLNIKKISHMNKNILICGNIGHGKTTFMDMLIRHSFVVDISFDSHKQNTKNQMSNKTKSSSNFFPSKFLDASLEEQQRGITMRMNPISLLLEGNKEKSYGFTFLDTPGHSNFSADICIGVCISDFILVVVDIVEGITVTIIKIIDQCLKHKKKMILVLNKIDRLILEMRLPLNDAYLKIKSLIDEFNKCIDESIFSNDEIKKGFYLSPVYENVIFSSSQYNILFTLSSISSIYNNSNSNSIIKSSKTQKTHLISGLLNQTKESFHLNPTLLWGDVYFNEINNEFLSKNDKINKNRTFVEFVLEPLYKIITYSICNDSFIINQYDSSSYSSKLSNEYIKYINKIKLNKELDSSELIRQSCKKVFFHIWSITDCIFKEKPTKQEENTKIESEVNVRIVRNFYINGGFFSFGKVISDVISVNDEFYFVNNDENDLNINSQGSSREEYLKVKIVNMFIFQTRYKIKINKAFKESLVLFEFDHQINTKTGFLVKTIQSANQFFQNRINNPLSYYEYPFLKVSVEPLIPSNLPKLYDSLSLAYKVYPQLRIKIEENSSIFISGTGEMYLDSVMNDVRNKFSNIEVKVSEPLAHITESVFESSNQIGEGRSNNDRNSIFMICESLDEGLEKDINGLNIDIRSKDNKLSSLLTDYLEDHYNWEEMTIDNTWLFSDYDSNINVLINYSLPQKTDQVLLSSVKPFIEKGFTWFCKEGPLCHEPVKNVKFKIIDSSISDVHTFRPGGQIIPMARKACANSMLYSCPKLMESIILVEILCPFDCISPITTILNKRRGQIIYNHQKSGTSFYTILAYLPSFDSFGFETDVRCLTAGLAFVQMYFDHWDFIPGDPIDDSFSVKVLEPASYSQLAKDIMVKMRRKKGLIDEISVFK